MTELPALREAEFELRLLRRVPAGAHPGWSPAYHFEMYSYRGAVLGWVDLRVSEASEVTRYNGNIGYTVRELHRGHRYAARGWQLLFELARLHGLPALWITCNPDNLASRRTCELVGAEYVETVDLPPDTDLYRRGDRQKCRYRVVL